jgi:phytoene dehydrogenase-like protein
MEKSMIIVGGGIAGLATGCYARMNGFKATIFEMHSVPGGLCTAWTRKGYTWDISMHMVTNSRKGPFRKMWEELGVVGKRQFHYHTEFSRIEGKDKRLAISIDRKAIEKTMVAISPADEKLINEFLNLLYGRGIMSAASLTPQELMSPLETLRAVFAILPLLGKMRKYAKTTIQDFAARFKDPFLRNAIRFCIDGPAWPMKEFPFVGMAGFLQSGMVDAGVPLGGSQKVMYELAEQFTKNCGEIFYRARVKDLIVENGKACGVRMENGDERRADIVVWAADGHHLIYDILGGRYVNDVIREMYEKWIPVMPLVHVMMGVNRDLSKEPARLSFELEIPIKVAGEDRSWISFIHRSFDPSMAPEGKSAAEVWYPCDYDHWEKLSCDKSKYEAEKKRIAKETIAALDRKWPGFAAQVEVVDVSTPVTYVRYTGNWKGSPDGWYITTKNMTKQKPVRSLPGLAGLYMAGQWTAPFTGTVTAALTGRQLIQMLCKKEGRGFKTSYNA